MYEIVTILTTSAPYLEVTRTDGYLGCGFLISANGLHTIFRI